MQIERIPIDNSMNVEGLWRGVAGSHDTIQYMLCELCDDAISSMVAHNTERREIIITIRKNKTGRDYRLDFEDSGAGIQNIEACMTFARTDAGETPLNRYGVALKKVLATFDPSNSAWSIYTHTESDKEKEQYSCIRAPYRIDGMEYFVKAGKWFGDIDSTGTIIMLPCSAELLKTATKDYAEGHANNMNVVINCISEELGVVYAPYLDKGLKIRLRWDSDNGKRYYRDIVAIHPKWKVEEGETVDAGSVTVNLGRGDILLSYRFGRIEEHEYTKKYFTKSFSSSGVMVYINGRLIESNIFQEIWVKAHPKFNAFIAVIELEAMEDPEALPYTAPTKDKLFYGDSCVTALYEWIRSHCPNPKKIVTSATSREKKPSVEAIHERDLRDQLVAKYQEQYGNSATVEKEVPFYSLIAGRTPTADIFASTEKGVTLTECKMGVSHDLDVFQLIMYHMGALHDGIHPAELVLVAERHPDGVKKIKEYMNSCTDPEGNHYNITLKTWAECGINSRQTNHHQNLECH